LLAAGSVKDRIFAKSGGGVRAPQVKVA